MRGPYIVVVGFSHSGPYKVVDKDRIVKNIPAHHGGILEAHVHVCVTRKRVKSC